ncbi:MAG TPA: glycosyltransferase family A protein, partial [Candidatus Kapabacteria bacterium]
MNGKISIIIITRNRLAYLKECVDSIRMQDHPDFEILIGDNGSTDATIEYLQELTKNDSRVTALFNGQNLGSCLGRNLLLQKASGDLWFIID